ncbi:hypothetical protein I7I53_04802 [Histoplasma capsulatum var. duboisii H88]|uniref:Uncharacterized protein n=1 Tax=Ajellomyces capsulatus (strain H88) TaxID=544711 RepID=A0A8A1LVX0_AJEC8|nr:hypothetical protein I7I53_04802 [Histoplasma capsulatum var. duboisii H88]
MCAAVYFVKLFFHLFPSFLSTAYMERIYPLDIFVFSPSFLQRKTHILVYNVLNFLAAKINAPLLNLFLFFFSFVWRL